MCLLLIMLTSWPSWGYFDLYHNELTIICHNASIILIRKYEGFSTINTVNMDLCENLVVQFYSILYICYVAIKDPPSSLLLSSSSLPHTRLVHCCHPLPHPSLEIIDDFLIECQHPPTTVSTKSRLCWPNNDSNLFATKLCYSLESMLQMLNWFRAYFFILSKFSSISMHETCNY